MNKFLFIFLCLLFCNSMTAQQVINLAKNKSSAKVKPLKDATYNILKVYDTKTMKVISADAEEGLVSVSKKNDCLFIILGYEDKEYGSLTMDYIIKKVKIYDDRIKYINEEERTCLILSNSKDDTKIFIKELYNDGTSVLYEVEKQPN